MQISIVVPLYNEDETVVVTFNGEIFNFMEVEKELLARGHKFRTRCDTEVIVHAWEEWGERCLERFNGMFAFAVWDRNQDTLFIARDRLGVKPLFYAEFDDGLLAFASELKAILTLPGVSRVVDPRAIDSFQGKEPTSVPKTIFTPALCAFWTDTSCTLARLRSRCPSGVSSAGQ